MKNVSFFYFLFLVIVVLVTTTQALASRPVQRRLSKDLRFDNHELHMNRRGSITEIRKRGARRPLYQRYTEQKKFRRYTREQGDDDVKPVKLRKKPTSELKKTVPDDGDKLNVIRYDNGTGHFLLPGAQLDEFKIDLEQQTGRKTKRRKVYRGDLRSFLQIAAERMGVVKRSNESPNVKTTNADLEELSRRQEQEYEDLVQYQREIETQLQHKEGAEAEKLVEIQRYNNEILAKYTIETANKKNGLEVFAAFTYPQKYNRGNILTKVKSSLIAKRDDYVNSSAPKSVPLDSDAGRALLETKQRLLYVQDAYDNQIYVLPANLVDPQSRMPEMFSRITHVGVVPRNKPQHRYVKAAGEIQLGSESSTRESASSLYSNQ